MDESYGRILIEVVSWVSSDGAVDFQADARLPGWAHDESFASGRGKTIIETLSQLAEHITEYIKDQSEERLAWVVRNEQQRTEYGIFRTAEEAVAEMVQRGKDVHIVSRWLTPYEGYWG